MRPPHRLGFRPDPDFLDDRCLLSALTPQQVTHAYGLDAVTFTSNSRTVKGDGSGQTIAIVVAYHDAYLASDLHNFDVTYNLPDPTLNVINLAGARADDGWAMEEAMDVEWAHAIAPGARILVVEARSSNLSDMISAVDLARNSAGVSVVSMSWGISEFSGETSYDSHFTTPAGHTGITFVAASGDSGPWAGAEYPSSSPNVLAVGGTSLSVGASGTYQGESVWSGSGGGYSRYEREPTYQRQTQSSGRRSSPDVSFNADPYTGASVFFTSPSSGRGAWQQVGGTSLGAPAWAGILAIVDQGRSMAGKTTLNSATQTMTALYSLPASDFHKVGSLTSTGLGTPNGASLIRDLVAGTPSTTTPSSTKLAQNTTTVLTTTTTGTGQSGGSQGNGRRHQGRRRATNSTTTALAQVISARLAPAQAFDVHDAALSAFGSRSFQVA